MGKAIGLRIKFIRECIGITQTELATKAGLSAPSICQYEKGERRPDLESLQKLKEALQVGYDVLLNNADLVETLVETNKKSRI